MKKTLLFIFMLVLFSFANAQVFISQNCDPKNNYVADRFAEIYNPATTGVDLTGWTLENVQGGTVLFTWTLSGTIAPGDALICGNADATGQTITPDITATWAGNSWNGKGGDGSILKNASGTVVDNAVQVDATGTFENAQMVRNPSVLAPNATYDASEWTFSAIENAVDATPGTHTVEQALVAADLFFSEYVEGKINGNNRIIEIFNGTGAEVDLSAYTVKQSHDGTGWGVDGIAYVLPLTGMLADGDVYVIANAEADASALAAADLTFAYAETQGAKIPFFTGDDALGLFKAETLIDVIGVPEVDPGYGWDVAGITEATYNHTLIRKNTVTQGNTDWATAAGTDATDSEWVVYDNATADYIENVGMHTFGVAAVDETAPTFTVTPKDGDTGVLENAKIVLTFNEAIRNINDSEITDANVATLITFKETDANGADVTFTATIDADKKVITVTPDADLKNSQLYYGAIGAVEDASDNATTASSMTFTTDAAIIDVTIFDIQNTTSDGDLSTYDGKRVRVSGIVTAIAGSNFWIQMQALGKDSQYPEWSGIFGYDAALAGAVVIGDDVTLEATVDEYYNATEIVSVTSHTVNSQGNIISPVAVTAANALEAYESTLITIMSAEVKTDPDSYGEFTVNDGTADYIVDDKMFAYTPTIGEFIDVTGVTTYSYGAFKLYPRSADDVVLASGVGIEDLTGTSIRIYPNPNNGKFFIQMDDAFNVNTKIEVFNVVGMKVLETTASNFKTEIDLSSMKQGVYYVRVDDGQNVLTQKIMKQ